jgi:hypothetical protein
MAKHPAIEGAIVSEECRESYGRTYKTRRIDGRGGWWAVEGRSASQRVTIEGTLDSMDIEPALTAIRDMAEWVNHEHALLLESVS